MWTMLAGVPGKMKTLLDRLTAARAANLDNLNATVSSRAPASTALSAAVWTNARALKLDDVQVPVIDRSSVSMSFGGWLSQSNGNGWVLAAVVGGVLFSTDQSTYQEVVNVTGPGLLNFIAAYKANTGSTARAVLRITIDGEQFEFNNTTNTNTTAQWAALVGALNVGGSGQVDFYPTFDQIPFRQSLKIELRVASSGSVSCVYKLRSVAS